MRKFNKKIPWIAIVLCLLALAALVIYFGPIMGSIGQFLVVKQEPQKADVIIVLGGGSTERVAYGAKLYQAGYGGKILLSGGNEAANRRMKTWTLALGIPESSILQEDQSRTTFENARYSLEIARAYGYKSAIVVTSPFHTRRAAVIFSQFFEGIDLRICPTPYDSGSVENWWKNGNSVGSVISEYLKLVWHYLFERK